MSVYATAIPPCNNLFFTGWTCAAGFQQKTFFASSGWSEVGDSILMDAGDWYDPKGEMCRCG